MFTKPDDLNFRMRLQLTSLLDGLANLGFAREHAQVNGGDLVDFLAAAAPGIRRTFHDAVRAGLEACDPHLFVAMSTAFTPLMEAGFYDGEVSINGADTTAAFAMVYHELSQEPVPLGLRPQVIYSASRGQFYTAGQINGVWGELDDAFLLHDCGACKAGCFMEAARKSAPDAAWIELAHAVACDDSDTEFHTTHEARHGASAAVPRP